MFHALLNGADRIAVLDVETTGLAATDEVVELAVVVLDADGDEVEAWESLFRPSVPMAPQAAAVNGLRDADLRHAPAFADLASEVARLVDGACIAAHNAPFDLRMLDASFRRIGSKLEAPKRLDSYRATRMKLVQALAVHGIPAVDLHHAMGDVRATVELLRRVARQLEPGGPARVTPTPAPTGAARLTRSGPVPPAPSAVSPSRERVEVRSALDRTPSGPPAAVDGPVTAPPVETTRELERPMPDVAPVAPTAGRAGLAQPRVLRAPGMQPPTPSLTEPLHGGPPAPTASTDLPPPVPTPPGPLPPATGPRWYAFGPIGVDPSWFVRRTDAFIEQVRLHGFDRGWATFRAQSPWVQLAAWLFLWPITAPFWFLKLMVSPTASSRQRLAGGIGLVGFVGLLFG